MNIRSVAAIGFAFFLAVGAAACGGDDTTGTNGGDQPQADTEGGDTTASDDTSGTPDESDTGPAQTGDAMATEDVPEPEPVDPCDPNPCTTAPPSMCAEDGSVMSYAADGECTVIDDDASCEYASTSTACEGDEFCSNGGCQAPGSPEDYVFSDDVSIVTTLGLAEDDPATVDVDEGDCCFDFNGDGQPDNGLGGLLQSLGSFLGDSLPEGGVNGLIQDQIDSGEIAILFEQVGLDDAANDESVVLNGFFGEASGDGSYMIDPSSFIEGTMSPYISFDNGDIADGVLTAGPALFSVTIPLGEFGFDIALDAQNTQIWSNVTAGAEGSGLDWTDGILGGVVPLQQLVDALNGLGKSCDCLGLGEAGMLELAAEDKLACTAEMKAAAPACNEEDDGSLCVGIADNSGLVCTAIGIIKPDIDTDLSGKKDSFSLGLRFEGVPATISGLVSAEEETPETTEEPEDGDAE